MTFLNSRCLTHRTTAIAFIHVGAIQLSAQKIPRNIAGHTRASCVCRLVTQLAHLSGHASLVFAGITADVLIGNCDHGVDWRGDQCALLVVREAAYESKIGGIFLIATICEFVEPRNKRSTGAHQRSPRGSKVGRWCNVKRSIKITANIGSPCAIYRPPPGHIRLARVHGKCVKEIGIIARFCCTV